MYKRQVNIVGKTIEEYAEIAQKLDGVDGVAGLEINISCPNVKEGGIAFGTDPLMLSLIHILLMILLLLVCSLRVFLWL